MKMTIYSETITKATTASFKKIQVGGVILAIIGSALLATSYASNARLSRLAEVRAGMNCGKLESGQGCDIDSSFSNYAVGSDCSPINAVTRNCATGLGQKLVSGSGAQYTLGYFESQPYHISCNATSALRCGSSSSTGNVEVGKWVVIPSSGLMGLCDHRDAVIITSPYPNAPGCTPTPTPTPTPTGGGEK